MAKEAAGTNVLTPRDRTRVLDRIKLIFLSMARQVGRTPKRAVAVGMSADRAPWAEVGWRSSGGMGSLGVGG